MSTCVLKITKMLSFLGNTYMIRVAYQKICWHQSIYRHMQARKIIIHLFMYLLISRLLSQPSLGWLNAFTLFLPSLSLSLPPQWLLILMAKQFVLCLGYFDQKIIGLVKCTWGLSMTLHVEVKSTHPITTNLGSYIGIWRNFIGNLFLHFFFNIWYEFCHGQTLYWLGLDTGSTLFFVCES